jgi:redox-sensitive bicupin YhaK (pirin superfamily)
MSNAETRPDEIVCSAAEPPSQGVDRQQITVLAARAVPLGGPRAITVRRTLPHRDRGFVGAWCFIDHYGPHQVAPGRGMDVAPHPHSGLATVSWLFEGEVEHRDSGGVHAMVRPGELNLMTAGHGIAHSEVSTPATRVLHGVQLWVVLPATHADTVRDFQHFAPPVIRRDGASVRVFIGSLDGQRSPVVTATPLLGAEVVLDPGAVWTVPADPLFEHGVLVDSGTVRLDGQPLHPGELGVRDCGPSRLRIANQGRDRARLLLLGGPPFEEEIVMWWNFIARSNEQIDQLREQWQTDSPRFGAVEGYRGDVARLPAPPLPGGTLRPRGRGGRGD